MAQARRKNLPSGETISAAAVVSTLKTVGGQGGYLPLYILLRRTRAPLSVPPHTFVRARARARSPHVGTRIEME